MIDLLSFNHYNIISYISVFLFILLSVCIVSNLILQYLSLVLDWNGSILDLRLSVIVYNELSRIIGDTLRLFVDSGREDALANVLGVIIHDDVGWLVDRAIL